MSVTKISSIRVLHGDSAAAKEIMRVIAKHKGSKLRAAEELGIGKTTLYRLISELRLWKKIDKLCKQNEFRGRAGRKRGAVDPAIRESIRAGRKATLEGISETA